MPSGNPASGLWPLTVSVTSLKRSWAEPLGEDVHVQLGPAVGRCRIRRRLEAWFCPKQFCSKKFCPKQFCPKQFCPKQFCSKKFCPKQLCLKQLCSKQFCSKQFCSKQICSKQFCSKQFFRSSFVRNRFARMNFVRMIVDCSKLHFVLKDFSENSFCLKKIFKNVL
jgi:hypothetical protein